MNNIQTNRDTRVFIVGDDSAIRCGIESIDNDGAVVIRGLLPETRRLFIPFTVFVVKRDGETVVQAKVLKVNWQEVQNVAAFKPEDVAATEIVAELLCDIEKCEYFEPLGYPGGISDRLLPDDVPDGTVYHTE